ncbi:MAG: arginine N-succinyltransferase, partial [Deltaproteobacteria bacterium]|nr:arginine N-succinyltransferase [Deltaproteobacteria bacterium]
SMIMAKHGAPGHPYYWFEVSTEERSSAELDRRFVHTKLRLRSTEDGPTEIGGLILDPRYRAHPQKCGKALSIVRFAYMSMHPDRFQREVTAEMLSPFKESGGNLLWDAFGQHFTGLDYREADHLSARNKQFIADLFPRDPVYATLLPKNVQQTIGTPRTCSRRSERQTKPPRPRCASSRRSAFTTSTRWIRSTEARTTELPETRSRPYASGVNSCCPVTAATTRTRRADPSRCSRARRIGASAPPWSRSMNQALRRSPSAAERLSAWRRVSGCPSRRCLSWHSRHSRGNWTSMKTEREQRR